MISRLLTVAAQDDAEYRAARATTEQAARAFLSLPENADPDAVAEAAQRLARAARALPPICRVL